MVNNTIQIEVYKTGTTRAIDASNELPLAQTVSFGSYYPGGIYGDATLYVPRDVLRWWALKGAQRIVFRNEQVSIWEGEIDALSGQIAADGEGILITCTGFWGTKLMRRLLCRYYIDNRTSADTWQMTRIPADQTKFRISRSTDAGDALLFTPNTVAMTSGDGVQLDYYAPTGEGIKKIVFDYDFQEVTPGEDYIGSLVDDTGGAASFTVSADGSANDQSWTGAAAAATTHVHFRFEIADTVTPAGDGTAYFEVTDIRVYAWTSNSGNFADNMDEIAKDLVAEFTTVFNSDVTRITTPASPFTLTSFAAEWISLADILTKAVAYGDGATPPNSYAAYLDNSEMATTPNGLPVLVLEVQPALTSYDVGVRLDGPNVVAPISIRKDYSRIKNWIIVGYTAAGGQKAYKTPDDDATLTDATSAAAPPTGYGQRDIQLDFGQADATTAIQLGKRYLAQWKDPKYILDGPITIQGYAEDDSGQPIPACRVRAGMRIRILDYIDDLSGTGLTMIITGTTYDAETETVSITTGAMDDLASIIAQLSGAAGVDPGGVGSSRSNRSG